MSTPLDNETVVFVKNSNLVECVSGIFYGIYFVVTAMAVFLLLRENKVSDSLLSRRILLLITLFMFIVDTGNFGALNTVINDEIRSLGTSSSSVGDLQNLSIALVVLARINYVMGDGIVVWRAFILFYKRNRLFCAILGFCFCASIASMFVDGAFAIRDVISKEKTNPTLDTLRRIILPCILFATNFIATLFIASTTWELRRNVELAFYRQSSRGKRVEWVLCLLVESGFLYCAVWVIVLINVVNHIPTRTADVLSAITPHLAGIYPTLIIILVAAQKSHCETTLQEDSIIRTTCLDMEEYP